MTVAERGGISTPKPQTWTSTTWAASPYRSLCTNELYRYEANRNLGDWLDRPLDAIAPKGSTADR